MWRKEYAKKLLKKTEISAEKIMSVNPPAIKNQNRINNYLLALNGKIISSFNNKKQYLFLVSF
jgi:hypothetical protein